MDNQWFSSRPTHCQLCGEPLHDAFIDGRTVFGPWAIMCLSCHRISGFEPLGIGTGQKYSLDTGLKLEG